MNSRGIFLLVLVFAFSSLAQTRLPRDLTKSGEGEVEEPIAYRAGLQGIKNVALQSLKPHPSLKECSTENELVTLLEKRFERESSGPKVVKLEKEKPVPVMETWLELPPDNPELFQTMSIPNELFAFALQMRVTGYHESSDGKVDPQRPFVALTGNSVWWGEKKNCKAGVGKTVDAVLDRFYAEYRTANPGTRLPSE